MKKPEQKLPEPTASHVEEHAAGINCDQLPNLAAAGDLEMVQDSLRECPVKGETEINGRPLQCESVPDAGTKMNEAARAALRCGHTTLDRGIDAGGEGLAKLPDSEIKSLLLHLEYRAERPLHDANFWLIFDTAGINYRVEQNGEVTFFYPRFPNGPTSTCLHLSYEGRDVDLMRLLIKLGANVNAVRSSGWSPLMDACSQVVHPDYIELLLEHGADPNFTDKQGWTPFLVTSCSSGRDAWQRRIQRLLVEFGADANATCEGGNTALHMIMSLPVSRRKFLPECWTYVMVAFLLTECGVSPNIRNDHGDTALMLAARRGATELAKLLLKNGANPWIIDNEGKLPVEVALYKATRQVIAKRMRQFLHRIEDRCQVIGPREMKRAKDNIRRIIQAAKARRIKWMKDPEDYFPEDYNPNDYDDLMEFANVAIDQSGRAVVVSSEEILSTEEEYRDQHRLTDAHGHPNRGLSGTGGGLLESPP